LSEIAWKPAHRQEIESGIVDDARRGVHAGDELLGEVEEEGEVAEGAASPPPSSVKGELIRGLREYSAQRQGPLSTSSSSSDSDGVSSSNAEEYSVASAVSASCSGQARSDSSTEPRHDDSEASTSEHSEPAGRASSASWCRGLFSGRWYSAREVEEAEITSL